jgi:hypothetical protein
MVTYINVEIFWWIYTNNIFDVLWEHLMKFEMNLMNIEYPKTCLK